MAFSLWRDGSAGCQAAEGVGGREPQAEEAAGRDTQENLEPADRKMASANRTVHFPLAHAPYFKLAM